MQNGRISAFARDTSDDDGGTTTSSIAQDSAAASLSYLDYICEYCVMLLHHLLYLFSPCNVLPHISGFLLSEVDKSTPMAIEYWQVEPTICNTTRS